MLFYVLAVTVPIYAAALYMSYHATEQRLKVEAERGADELAARLAAGMDAVIRPIEGGIRTVAGQLEEVDPPRSQYVARIRGILAAWPDVYGSTIAVEVADGDARGQAFAPYLFRDQRGIQYSDLATDSYAYRRLPWYRNAADSRRPVWSLPYFDAGGGETWMVTYSVPFFRRLADDQRVLAGVITADLDMKWVSEAAAKVPLGQMGMGWLVSPPTARSFITPIGATAQRIASFDASIDAERIREAGENMLARDVTFAPLPAGLASQPAYLAVRNLETLDWRLMLIVPQATLLAEARNLLHRQLWLGAAGLLVIIGAISLVAAAISRPIHALAEAVGTASEDHLAFSLPELRRSDEVGVLTEALRRMRDSLQRHIHMRAESLAAEARLEHDLQIAASIQQSMLPRPSSRVVPAGVRVAATLLPAKQVGGDLHDYFAAGETNLLFAIADVSDKGIPAALFMARSAALLKMLGAIGHAPNRLLYELNVRLVEDNDTCMFVTLGCGLLNVRTGRVQYASAGHEPPLLRHSDGTVRPISVDNGTAIGIEPAAEYPVVEAFMAPGDTLVLFTDGVTEATAQDESQFGTDRLVALLGAAPDGDPDVLVRRIVDSIAAAGFRATDDLSVLAINLSPSNVTVRQAGPATHWLIEPKISAEGVAETQQWLQAILAARDIAQSRIGDAELIAEELLTNVIRVLEPRPDAAHLSLDCALTPSEIVLTVRDDGPQFDPLEQQRPDLEGDIEKRSVGGLGIVLVRELADSCRYARVEDRNVMEIRLNRIPA
jgi:sigma-B regulation protein RsbU (phosphoserine phosphatase)